MKQEQIQTNEDFLYLIYCALHNTIPNRERVLEMHLAELFRLAKFHTLSAITYDALEQLKEKEAFSNTYIERWSKNEPENIVPILRKWEELRDKAFRKNMMLDAERQKLSAYFCKYKIWHMPLKGVVLKELYPNQEMRQMADNDILFDADYEETVREYFIKNGYDVIAYQKGNHDSYEKKPIYNYEMHTSLFDKERRKAWCSYYNNVKSKLIHQDDSYLYAFTDDDFYIYFIIHAFKHFDYSGNGIRSFVDCYVYQSCKNLDWDYIETELNKLGVLEFEKTFRSVAWKLFGKGEPVDHLTESEYKMLYDSMQAGTYGTMRGRVENMLRKSQGNQSIVTWSTKYKYLLGRLFPPISFYKKHYPLIYKSKVLIPFFAIYRIFKGILFRGKYILQETKLVHHAGKDASNIN